MNYATSSSAGFSASDVNGVRQVVLQRQAFNGSSYSTVFTKGGSTVNLSEAGYGSSFADYRVLATDMVGNAATTSAIVLRNWIPTLKVTASGAGGDPAATITGGTQYIGNSNSATTPSLTRYPGQTFYLRAKPNLGYLFNGFDIQYSNLNSGLSNSLTYSYASISYDTGTGFFNCAIVLSDNLCDLDNTYTEVSFRAKFTASVVTTGYLAPYNTTYNGSSQAYPSADSNYLSVGSLGSDRAAVITHYRSVSGSWVTAVPSLADTYDIRVVVRNTSTTTTIYGTYELLDCMVILRKEVTISFASSNKTC